MRGAQFLREPADHDLRMSAATNDEQLSDICRDIEAMLTAEGAGVDEWVAYESIRDEHIARVYSGAGAG